MQRLLHILLLLLSLTGSVDSFAQETEAQLKEKAEKLFQSGDYVGATPAYSQLLALQPRNPQYNYKYGTCLLFNSRKKQEAIKYLEFATASQSIELEAFYYMGKAYHINYQFDEAIKFYTIYKTNSKGKSDKALEVERHIDMCENGKKLLTNITDIVVLEKTEYAVQNFYSLYNLANNFGGEILVSAAQQSKIDKKKGFVPVIYFPPNSKKVFFATYGDNEANGKEIYYKYKLPSGAWSTPEPVKGDVNTRLDEDFPYMHPNGKYLYFSSQGHSSMGGFDVFRSKYNEATNSFGPPENLDFAISSTDDDLFYIVDSLDKTAWFASSRQSQNGQISVYNVRVERLPASVAAIKGMFASTVHPENKKFNIEVKDLSSGKSIGTFYSDKDGGYLIALPKGGKYEYSIKITGSPRVFKAVVNVPVLNEFKPLKQKIIHEDPGTGELVKVIDLPDEAVDDPAAVLAEIVRLRSELNPNASQFDLAALDKSAEGSKAIFAELGMPQISPMEAKDRITGLTQAQETQAKELKDLQQKALAKAVSNTAEIKTLQAEVKSKAGEVNKTADPQEKYNLYVEAEQKITRITELEAASGKLLVYADSIGKRMQEVSVQASKAKQLDQALVKASKTGDDQILQVISENKVLVKQLQSGDVSSPSETLVRDILKLKAEKDQLAISVNSYKETVAGIRKEITSLESSLSKAKSKEKPGIQSSIDTRQGQLEMVDQEIATLEKKYNKTAAALEQKEDELEYLQQLQKEKLPAKELSSAETNKVVAGAENQNYKTLKAYVSQQKTELAKMTAVSETPVKQEIPEPEKQPAATENILRQLKPELERRFSEIAKDPELTPLEKLKMAQNEDLEFEHTVGERITELEAYKESHPEDKKVQSELKSLRTIREEANERIDNRSLTISSLDPEYAAENPVEKPVELTVAEHMQNEHTARLQKISNDPALTPDQRNQQAQRADEELKSAISIEIQRVQRTLKKSPGDAGAREELQVLEVLAAETAQRIETRENTLKTPGEIPERPVQNMPETAERVKPGHAAKTAAIQQDAKLSQQEKQNKLIVEEVKLQKALAEEIRKTEKKLLNNPSDPELLAVKEQLALSREESRNRSDESGQFLAAEAKALIKPADLLVKTDKTYEREIQDIENADDGQETAKLIARERSSQQILQAKIAQNNAQLAKKDNPALVAENQVLNELIDAAQQRIEQLETRIETPEATVDPKVEKPVSGNPEPEKSSAVTQASIRAELLGAESAWMERKFYEEEELRNQQQALTSYQSALQRKQQENAVALKKTPKSKTLLETKEILLTEISATSGKLKDIQQQLVVFEKPVASVDQPVAFSENPDLRALQKEGQELQAKMQDPSLSNQQKGEISKEIKANEVKQAKMTNEVVSAQISQRSAAITREIEKLESSLSILPQGDLIRQQLENVKNATKNTDAALKTAAKEKDPLVRQEQLKNLEAKQQQNEEKLESIQSDAVLAAALQKNGDHPDMDVYSLQPEKVLQARRYKAKIEIGDLTSEIERLDAEIKSSGRSQAKALMQERQILLARRESAEQEVAKVDNELEKRSGKTAPVYNESAINETITYAEERKVAASPEYRKYVQAVGEATLLKDRVNSTESKLEALKNASQVLLEEKSGLSDVSEKVSANIREIAQLTQQLATERSAYSEKQQAAAEVLSNHPDQAMKIQNLIARGIDPIRELAIVSTLIPMPAKGFEIIPNAVSKTVKTEIPVGLNIPSGLVYRVQVGAFKKTVDPQLFREFNPVSGEKLNSGITRYMAGYFNDRSAVLEAQQQIRAIGYADAFPVAYCDGERISMEAARRLEQSGLCKAQGIDNLVIDIPQNAQATIPADTTRKALQPQTTASVNDPGAYNQLPGAAKAIAAETRLGLFYTVQVGVYNKPVPASQIKNMEPLITKRLPNGQIRYSAGMFSAVDQAQPKKQEAQAKGIKDAFITSYYKGERISLDEAARLLAESGPGILEKNNPRENKIVPETKIKQLEAETQRTEIAAQKVQEAAGTVVKQFQFVSKKEYETFPRDVLRRFNEQGFFYYDAHDRRIKSVVYTGEDAVPQVYFLRNELDTLIEPAATTVPQDIFAEISARYAGKALSGEIGNWLIRSGYQRKITVTENEILILFSGIGSEKDRIALKDELEAMGMSIQQPVKQ